MKRRTAVSLAVLAAAVALAVYWFQHSRDGKPGSGAERSVAPVPVIVAKAAVADIPVMLEVVGRAEAYESVSLKSRLDGQVTAVPYGEGQKVRQGEVLVRLDAGDFEARLQQTEANLARDVALLAKARADVTRYEALRRRGFVSEEKVNEVRTIEAAATATVRADQASLELARRQVSYTTIRAPFDGVVGARLVFPGSAVKLNDTILAVVNRVRPLYISFAIPEQHLPRLRAALAEGSGMRASISLPGDATQRLAAPVTFLDNAVDTATGTVQMKAVLENRDEALTPGQYLNVSLTLATRRGPVRVPSEAVQQGPEGKLLYVVRDDNTVEPRTIEVNAGYRGLTAIGKGVAAGETVVTDGQLRLAPGTRVQANLARPLAPSTGIAPSPASGPDN